MQKLSAYNLAQNNNCGLITCSICGRSYRITEFGTDADCQSNSPSASVPNFCPYCASPFERPLTRVRKQEIEDYILDELLARRGYAKEIRNRYASAVPDYGEDNVRAAGQAGTHSVQQPVIESGRTREQSDKNVEH